MTHIPLTDTYFVEVHWHVWTILSTALAVLAIGWYWKLRKR